MNEKSHTTSLQNRIHFIYFSCKKHFKYLSISLKSLDKLALKYMGNVYLYIDKNDYLSDFQISHLKQLRLNIKFKRCDKVTGWGRKSVITEISSFKKISKEIGSYDILTKVDSDVLFISDIIFKKILKSNYYLFFGKKETSWKPYEYAQGGCYFLKNSLIDMFDNFERYNFDETLKKLNSIRKIKRKQLCKEYPEDAAIFDFVKSKTNKIKFINFYLHPNKLVKWKYYSKKKSVVHFGGKHKNKMIMFHKIIKKIIY